jgi:hypothetical protein
MKTQVYYWGAAVAHNFAKQFEKISMPSSECINAEIRIKFKEMR